MNNQVVIGTDNNFRQEVLESSIPVLVDFWAPWCGPCRIIGPVIEELAEEYNGKFKVVKLNTDENPEITYTYGIMSIPTIAIFKKGKVVDGTIGAVPKKFLIDLMNKHMDNNQSNV